MFRTKKDVDKHCQEVLKKCENERDKNLRSLNIAQQYFNVRDYESARRYVTLFLSVKDDSPIAHRLLAQCLEQFGEKEKALTEYKYSLSLDSKQPELYLKVCELYADNSVLVDKSEAKYWHDRGEIQFPYHPAIHKLKQKMFAIGDSQNGKSIESALKDELMKKPNDAIAHAQLITFYIENGRISDAYELAFRKKIAFTPNLTWYLCGVRVCKSYKTQLPTSLNEDFYGNYLFVLDRSLALSVQDVKMHRKGIPECIALLANFDELLSEVSALSNNSERFLKIINYMCGQLCFHTVHIVYRKAKWQDENWSKISKLIMPLLLLSTSDNFDISKVHEEGTLSQIMKTVIPLSLFRINVTGYILSILSKESPKLFMKEIVFSCSSDFWRERVCEIIYNTSNYKTFSKTSFFVKSDKFSKLPAELAKNLPDNIDRFVFVTGIIYPASIHHLVWIGVNYLVLSERNSICNSVLPLKFGVELSKSIQFSHNTASTFAETLCSIDINAFLYACVYCAKSSLDQQINQSKPLTSYILPPDVSKSQCSPDHDLWWEYVNQMISQTLSEENYNRARSLIQRGIENVRLVGNNTLPLHLLVLLGRTFANKATVETDSVRASALESRALLYWKAAFPLLEKTVINKTNLTPCKSMFEYQEKIITESDAAKLIMEGKRFVGMQTVKEKNYSDAVLLDESCEGVNNTTSFSQRQPSSHHSLDDNLFRTLYEQNTRIMDKLETLFNKQELLSSNQFQLFETVSALSKKIDDLIIMPYDCYLDALSNNEPSVSPQNPSQVPSASFTNKPAPVMSVSTTLGNTSYPMPTNVQTNFPLHHFGQPTVAVTSATMSPFLVPYLTGQPPLRNYQMLPDTKESYINTNRSIASSSIFDVNTPTTAGSTSVLPPFTKPLVFGEKYDLNRAQLAENSYFGTVKPFVSPSTTITSFSPRKDAMLMQLLTSSPGSHSTVISTTMHSFQIPNSGSPLLSSTIHISNKDDLSAGTKIVVPDSVADFKPIVPLKMDEEGEEILFENRAELSQLNNGEWKECGIGPLKILRNPATFQIRMLMRRDLDNKICACHFIYPDMFLTPFNGSDLAWIFSAQDFSTGELNYVQLCIKFQCSEVSAEFREVFEKLKCKTTHSSEELFSEQLLVSNPVAKLSTPAANSLLVLRDGEKSKKPLISPSIMTNVKVTKEQTTDLGKTQLGGFTFSSKPIVITSTPEKKDPVKTEEKIPAPFAAFSGFNLNNFWRSEDESKFCLSSTATTTAILSPASNMKKDSESCLPFCDSVQNAVDFSSLSKITDASGFRKSENFKGFAGAGAPVFGSTFAKPQPITNTSTSSFDSILKNISGPKSIESTKNVSTEEEFVPTAEFPPVIPLPELVEVKTGEEGLELLYEEQCKLFRFVGDEWKERGIGKMKILRDPASGYIRLLMRRDQVHKVCCNQRLTTEHELKPLKTTDKAWTWIGHDFSEGELKNELLCVRFKTVDQAAVFKKSFEDAKAQLSTLSQPDVSSTTASSTAPSTLPSLSEMFKRDVTRWECKGCYVTNNKDVLVCVACQQPKDGTTQPESNKCYLGSSGDSFQFSANPTFTSSTPFLAQPTVTLSAGLSNFSFGSATSNTVFSFGVPTPTASAAPDSSPKNDSNAPVFSIGHLPRQKGESGGQLFGNTNFHFGNPSVLTKHVENSSTDISDTKSDKLAESSVTLFGGTGGSNFSKPVDTSSVFSNFSFKLKDYGDPPTYSKESKLAQKVEKPDTVSKQSSSDDVEFVSETKVPEGDKQLAESLMLPTKFFAYKYTDKNCPGCVGCDEEDSKNGGEVSKANTSKDSLFKAVSQNIPEVTTVSNVATNEKISFVFGNTTENTSWLGKSSFNFGGIFNCSNVTVIDNPPQKKPVIDEESEDEKDNSVEVNDHERNFEAAASLPNFVETKTGEEDETIEFSERSRIYRYDEVLKVWKERGVGELKVLFHPEKKSYRLLLRRDQVHKVVLNQRITTSLNIQPLSTTPNSLCWFGMNFPEEATEPVIEKLAARFKTEENMKKFQDVVSRCVAQLTSQSEFENADEGGVSQVGDVNEEECDENNYDVSYDENNDSNYNARYGEHDYYVDQQAMQDAMKDVESGSEIVFDSPVTLKIFEGDSAVDYEGIIQLVRKNSDDLKTENMKSYVEFSTPDIPSLYKADISNSGQVLLENNCVTILEEESDAERKVSIHFEEKKLANQFVDAYKMIK